MSELNVTPPYLEGLAQKHDTAKTDLGMAGEATRGIGKEVWLTHGVICGAANTAIAQAEASRSVASVGMKAVSEDLAEKLRAARGAYESTDEQTGRNIDKQVRDR